MLLWEKLVISLCWRLSTDTKLGHRRAALCHHIDSSGGADGLSCAPKCTGSKRQLSDLSTAIVTALQGQEQRREPLNEFKGRQSSGEREKANRKRVGTGDAHLGALHRAAPSAGSPFSPQCSHLWDCNMSWHQAGMFPEPLAPWCNCRIIEWVGWEGAQRSPSTHPQLSLPAGMCPLCQSSGASPTEGCVGSPAPARLS